MRIFVTLLVLALTSMQAAAELRVATWNIERLGAGGQKSFVALAEVISEVDFVAVQEVMTEEAIVELQAAVERRTGETWGSLVSHRVGRGSYKEMYAFLWREAAIEYVDGAVVYLDRGDHFAREPFSARFMAKMLGETFVAAQVHVIYGDSEARRVAEVQRLREYWDWMAQVYPETSTVMLMGDFNLPPSHPAWRAMREVASPLVTRGATTLSSHEGRYANLYDNIWLASSAGLHLDAAEVVRYPQRIGWTHAQARRFASDHAPVMARFSGLRQAPQASIAAAQPIAEVASSREPVRGNRNSMVYHIPACPNFNDIASRNRENFGSEEQALEAGYRKARNCP